MPSYLEPLIDNAADLCCTLLRADAMALSLVNSTDRADAGSGVRWQGPFPPQVPAADAVVGHAADGAAAWLCTPALWRVRFLFNMSDGVKMPVLVRQRCAWHPVPEPLVSSICMISW